MALSKIDVSKMITGVTPLTNGGTGGTSIPATNLASAVTGTLPVANGGTAITSGFVNGSGTGNEIDSFSYNATTATTGATLTTNWIRTTGYFNKEGTGMSVDNSTGVFTFPSTGFYQVTYKCVFTSQNATSYVQNSIILNGGSVTSMEHIETLSNNQYQTYGEALYKVDDTSADTIKFGTNFGGNSNTVIGATADPYTGVTFLKLRAI